MYQFILFLHDIVAQVSRGENQQNSKPVSCFYLLVFNLRDEPRSHRRANHLPQPQAENLGVSSRTVQPGTLP